MEFTNKINLDQELIDEYFKRKERKKEDEDWIKENRLKVIEAFKVAGKSKGDFGNIRVSVTVPDASKFDVEKVLEYVESKGLLGKVVTPTLDETKLEKLVEIGEIDLTELKKYAWIESKGSPRVTLDKLNTDAN